MDFWKHVRNVFGHSEAKIKVIETLIRYGLTVKIAETKGGFSPVAYLDSIPIPYNSLAVSCGVDWRTVKETLERIMRDRFLKEFFANMENAGPFLRGVVKLMGYRCIVIETVRDQPGILAFVSSILAEKGINILQVIAEHPLLVETPKLYVIIQDEIPGDVVPRLLQNNVIKSITVY